MDDDLRAVHQLICDGWPERRDESAECARPYFNERQSMTVQGNLVFRGNQVVVPTSMRAEMIAVTHRSHMGIESCLRRMRESLYWPQMAAALKDHVAQCEICIRHQRAPPREPMLSHSIPDLPWIKIAADLCELDGRVLVILCDYYSNYIEVESIRELTSAAVIRVMHSMFARWGIPEMLITDNGPCFSSADFKRFTEHWGVEHTSSSTRYAQSNGRAERAIGAIKELFRKCKAAGVNEAEALLDYRNTPNDTGFSPAQLIMGRRCRTRLVTNKELLQPMAGNNTAYQRRLESQNKVAYHYNKKGYRIRQPFQPGQHVTIRLPGQSTWTRGVCIDNLGHRSYNVQVGSSIYRRTSKHIRAVAEPKSTKHVTSNATDD